MIATLAVLAALVLPAHAEIEFSGYLKAEDAMKFALGDPAAQKKPEWFTLGGVFDGYTVIGFDAKKETLAVEKAGTTTYLPLKPGVVPQVTQTGDAQQNSPYTLPPRLDERRKMEQVLVGERQSVLRRKTELDRLLDQVGGSHGGTGEAMSIAQAVRRGDPRSRGGGGPNEAAALVPFTFQRDPAGVDPTGAPAIPDLGRITIAPINLGGGPVDPHTLALELEEQRERELRELRSSRAAKTQAEIDAMEAEIRLLKQERAQALEQERSRIVVTPAVPDWQQTDYVLRSYRERLQDLRTRYAEDHPWIQSVKAGIARLEQQRSAAPQAPPAAVKKPL